MNDYHVTRRDGQQALIWYDRHLRLWTTYLVDEKGHQAGPAEYDSSKAEALRSAEVAKTWDQWQRS